MPETSAVPFYGTQVDVLVDRKSLTWFYQFCTGNISSTFRLDLYLVQNTLIIERSLKSPSAYRGAGPVYSTWAESFKEAVVQMPRACEHTSCHHRVIQYDFGGLKLAVRYEVEASLVDPKSSGVGMRPPSVVELRVDWRGSLIQLPSWYHEMWFARTQYLVAAHHENGTFDRPRVLDLKDEIFEWESHLYHRQALQRMAVLLRRLRDIVRGRKDKACVVIGLVFDGFPKLLIYEATSGNQPLPTSVVKKFWQKPKR